MQKHARSKQMSKSKKFGVPALAGSCASEARRNPTKVGTPNAKQNLTKLLLTCLILRYLTFYSMFQLCRYKAFALHCHKDLHCQAWYLSVVRLGQCE